MNRRSFIGSILLAAAAPAIVRADSLMRIVPLDTKIVGVASVDLNGVWCYTKDDVTWHPLEPFNSSLNVPSGAIAIRSPYITFDKSLPANQSVVRFNPALQ
jgi:hypothetical protein